MIIFSHVYHMMLWILSNFVRRMTPCDNWVRYRKCLRTKSKGDWHISSYFVFVFLFIFCIFIFHFSVLSSTTFQFSLWRFQANTNFIQFNSIQLIYISKLKMNSKVLCVQKSWSKTPREQNTTTLPTNGNLIVTINTRNRRNV